MKLANQLQMQNRPESFPQAYYIGPCFLMSGGDAGCREETWGKRSKNSAFRETFCVLHKQLPLPDESEFPNGIILGPSVVPSQGHF